MKTIISVYIPNFSTKRVLNKHPERDELKKNGLILFREKDGEEIVARCCPLSRRLGVSPGLTLAHAKALAPNAKCMEFELLKDIETLYSLAKWTLNFSPLVSVDLPTAHLTPTIEDELSNGINIDVSGSLRLFGGAEKIIESLRSGIKNLGFSSKVCLAPTLGSAWAVSRYSKNRLAIVEKENLKKVLYPLPTSALRINSITQATLQEVGIQNIEQLLAVPQKSLASGFNKQLLTRLRQALGEEEEIIVPYSPATPLSYSIKFSGPSADLEAIKLATKQLLEQAVDSLAQQSKKASEIFLIFKRPHSKAIRHVITLSFPSTDHKHIWSLMLPRVEKLNMGHGVDEIRLAVSKSNYLNPFQESRDGKKFESEENNKYFFQLLDSLSEELGTDKVLNAENKESYIPEHSFSYESAKGKHDCSKKPGQALGYDRPSILFKKPFPVRALSLMPDHPPQQLKWNDINYKLTSGLGPERISPEWWQEHGYSDNETRDYFKVQTTSGMWLWVYREVQSSKWYVHGMWS